MVNFKLYYVIHLNIGGVTLQEKLIQARHHFLSHTQWPLVLPLIHDRGCPLSATGTCIWPLIDGQIKALFHFSSRISRDLLD